VRNHIAPNLHEARLPSVVKHAEKQEGIDYCWAACLAGVLNYHGSHVSQEQIMDRIKGKVREDGSNAGSVLDMMAGRSGVPSFRFLGTADGNMMWQDVLANCPVILGLAPPDGESLGHVILLVGIRFSLGQRGEVILHELEVFDPANGGTSWEDATDMRPKITFSLHYRR